MDGHLWAGERKIWGDHGASGRSVVLTLWTCQAPWCCSKTVSHARSRSRFHLSSTGSLSFLQGMFQLNPFFPLKKLPTLFAPEAEP